MALPRADLLKMFQRANAVPLGTHALDRVLWKVVPFNAAIKPHVLKLTEDEVLVRARLRPLLRNHLGSMHAAVLFTLGEYAQGLVMVANAGNLGAELILRELNIEYLAKARGAVKAHAVITPQVRDAVRSAVEQDGNAPVTMDSVVLDDGSGAIVARLRGHWKARRPRR